MELQALKLIVTDADVNQLLEEFAPKDLEVKNLRVQFTPDGVRVTGSTKALLFTVSFDTLWELALNGKYVEARLNSLKVAGVPAGKLRGILLKMVRDAVAKHPGITVEGEVVRVDANEGLRARGVPLQITLSVVR